MSQRLSAPLLQSIAIDILGTADVYKQEQIAMDKNMC